MSSSSVLRWESSSINERRSLSKRLNNEYASSLARQPGGQLTVQTQGANRNELSNS